MRLSLFPKYALLITALVAGLLALSWSISLRISYEESIRHFRLLQQEKANSAATRIGEFLRDIEQHIGLIDLIDNRDEQRSMLLRKHELLKLFKQLPQLFEITWIDSTGHEQIFLSRANLDRWGHGSDLTKLPGVAQVLAGKVHFGHLYFKNDSEPHMLLMRPTAGGGGVIADINLKLIWSTVNSISEGKQNVAYVVDRTGVLIAHPDIDLVLRKLNFKELPQVGAALGSKVIEEGRSWSGIAVLSAFAQIPDAGWLVFVETPLASIQDELNSLIQRATLVLIFGIVLSIVSSYLLARRMITPIKMLSEGVDRITHGDFNTPIAIRSRDELENLASGFNRMGAALQVSYSELEEKVANRTLLLEKERSRVVEVLHNILPASVAAELAEHGHAQPIEIKSATILFTDFAGFTQAASAIPADRMVAELNEIFSAFDDICRIHGVEKIKTIGDAYMAASGVPLPCADHAQRAAKAGLAMCAFVAGRNESAAFKWQLRVGLHSGPVVAGVVGKHKYAFDVWGDTVNTASRMESAGEAGKVNVSAYTYDLIRNDFSCSYRGKLEAKGKGEVDMYFIVEAMNT